MCVVRGISAPLQAAPLKWSRLVGILEVEIVDKLLRVCEVFYRFPSVVSEGVALPSDEVLELPSVSSGVEDLFHDKFFFPVNYHGWWWWLLPAEDGGSRMWFKQGGVKHVVDAVVCW